MTEEITKLHKRHYEQFADGTVKDIEDEIPFDVPEGWAWIRQKNLGIALNGKAFKPSDWTKKGLPIVRIQNLNDKNAPYNYYDKDVDETFLLHGGELLFAWSGTPGTSFGAHIWDKGEAVLNQHIFKILFDETIINKIFYKYCLNNQVEKLIEVAHGSAGLAHITKNMFDEVLIPLPPYNEQLRIVTEFEKIISLINYINDNKTELNDTIKQTKSKILDLAIHGKLVPQDPNDEPAEELLKRIATSDNRPYEKVEEEPFEIPDSWKWVKLNDLAEIARGGSPRPIQDYITDNQDGINWIKIGDTSEKSKYITSSKEKIKPEGKKHSRYVHAGDFLLTNSMSFGRPYILKIDGCIHDGWLVFANIKECLLQDYLYYALSSAYIYETFSNVAAGSTVKNLKSDTVKQVDFPLPPLSEQRMIVKAIENMYEVLDQIQNNFV